MRRRKETLKTEGRRRRSLVEQIENRELSKSDTVEDPGPDPSNITPERLIPSGSTVLNCACSGNPFGAFALGSINTIPGKSASGKTVLALSILTECACDKRFDEYDLYYDDSEQSLGFDLDRLFTPLVQRLKSPNIDDESGSPISSETIQDFQAKLLELCEKGKPFIYILDSLDSLTSTEELEREYKQALALAKSDEAVKALSGSYKAEKAKHIGEALRMINGYIKHSNSALFIIQQTRQKLNAPAFAQQWTTSGGEAPFFYSFHRLYLNKTKAETGEAKGVKFKIGGRCVIDIVKNKLTGKIRKAEFSIYEDYGIDDINSCIDFLIKFKHWKSDSGGITTKRFVDGFDKIKRDKLVAHIEKNNMQKDLQTIVGQVWTEIEDELKLDRIKRY